MSKSWEIVSNRERSHPVDQTPKFLFFRLWLVVHTMDEVNTYLQKGGKPECKFVPAFGFKELFHRCAQIYRLRPIGFKVSGQVAEQPSTFSQAIEKKRRWNRNCLL